MVWLDEWLERLFWLSLALLPVLLTLGGYGLLRRLRPLEEELERALRAVSTSQLIEILRLLEQGSTGDARATVLIDVAARERNGENWWEADERLHRAAASVCTTYDHVAGIINFDSGPAGQFFLETWGEEVIRVHDVLERYLDLRRSSGVAFCSEFTWLAQEARRIHHRPQAAELQHPVRTVLRHLKS